MAQVSGVPKPKFSVMTGTSIGILLGVVMALFTTICGPVLLRLSGARSLHELWWSIVDIVRNTEDWLCGLGQHPAEPAYYVQRIALSPVGLWMLLAVISAGHLFYFRRKRSR